MALKVCQLCAVDFTLKHFLLPLIDGMKSEGWNVTAVCSDGSHIQQLRKEGYNIETIPIERSLNLVSHFRSVIILTQFLKKNKFDIIHVHSPIAALIGRVAARLASVPMVIYTAHGFYFHDEMPYIKKTFFILLEKWAGRFTHVLLTQSQEDAIFAKQENLISKGTIYSIGNGVNADVFKPKNIEIRNKIRRQLGVPKNAFVIGIIARLVKEKGVCEFLNAAIKASEENNRIYFLVIGERLDSDHAQEVSHVITRAKDKLADKIIFLGQREDIPELISIMDVFCLPSWREGMPRSIIEAMMMGKAVIATNIRGSREEVLDGKTGFLLPTRNECQLKKQFLYCADNPKEIKKMGEAGRTRALRCYDENMVIKEQIEIIRSYMNSELEKI